MKTRTLDKQASRRKRDSGIEAAVDHAESQEPGWKDQAVAMVAEFVRAFPEKEFMTEEVRVWAYNNGLPKPPHGRAWGAVIQAAVKLEMVKHAGYGSTRNPKTHGTPASVWVANAKAVKSIRYRASQCWSNVKTLEKYYGIQAQKKKGQRWMMSHNNGVALIYRTKAQAEKIARWLNDPTGMEPEWNTDLVT